MRDERAKYRRRRLGAVLCAGVFAWALYAGAGADAGTSRTTYTVAPGDSLWTIAASHYPPSEDLRVRIEEIREINGLQSYRIHPGTRLKLPSAETQ